MELRRLEIEGAWIASSPVWKDERGNFREWFKYADILSATGINFDVAQANISSSAFGVVRGVHYSLNDGGQSKWVTCVSGKSMDVIVDIRPKSATYGKYVTVDLAADDGRAVLIGADLGHGFISLEQGTVMSYLLSSPYSPESEYGINPMDPAIGISWGIKGDEILLSPKDKLAPSLAQRAIEGMLPI